MAKNYDALHHIQTQMSKFDSSLSMAIQRLFIFEDNRKQDSGCVIDSVVAKLIFAKFGINADIHLGEICADGNQDAYHCWLTIDDKIFDIGIFGNSNYNPFYRGDARKYPVIFEHVNDVIYVDGSTETSSWLASLSELPFVTYIKNCPDNMVCKMYCYALEIFENKANIEKMYELAKNMHFPTLLHIECSPSNKKKVITEILKQ